MGLHRESRGLGLSLGRFRCYLHPGIARLNCERARQNILAGNLPWNVSHSRRTSVLVTSSYFKNQRKLATLFYTLTICNALFYPQWLLKCRWQRPRLVSSPYGRCPSISLVREQLVEAIVVPSSNSAPVPVIYQSGCPVPSSCWSWAAWNVV